LPAVSERIAIPEHQVLVIVKRLGFTRYQAAGGAPVITDAKQEVIVAVRAGWITAVTAQ